MDKVISFFTTFYKDPLFSIIILLSIIILVALADFTRNRFKAKQKEHSLKALAENFNFYELDSHLNDALHFSKTPKETLIIIAQIYVKSGNFDDAIKIYLAILDRISDLKGKIEIFELLGSAYFRAGFLQRAKEIFIEILKHNPRSENALLLLMQTYEVMGDYNSALEVISCLEEVRGVEHFRAVKTYIKMLILINDSLMSASLREREITKLMAQGARKLALQYFLAHNPALFWEAILACEDAKNYIDLLWNVPLPSAIQDLLQAKIAESNQDSATRPKFVESSKQIADIYRAKGVICDDMACENFELETLRILRKHSHKRANLGFKYKCKSCQGIFPFDSHRCQNCAEVGEMSVVVEIVECK